VLFVWKSTLSVSEKVVPAVFLLSKYTGPEPRELQLLYRLGKYARGRGLAFFLKDLWRKSQPPLLGSIPIDVDMEILETVRIVLRNANTFYREANKDKRVKRGVSGILDELYMMVLNWDAENLWEAAWNTLDGRWVLASYGTHSMVFPQGP
jgi:hypothetical protein